MEFFLLLFFGLSFLQERSHYTDEEVKANLAIKKFSQSKTNWLITFSLEIDQKLNQWFGQITTNRVFTFFVIAYFIVNAFASFLTTTMIGASLFIKEVSNLLTTFDYIEIGASIIYSILVVVGSIYLLRKKRLQAFVTYRYATYFSILVLQFFAFFHNQLLAVVGLFFNLCVLASLKYMEKSEREKNS